MKCIEDEIPFELPEGWRWTRIQNITQICLGLTHTPKYVESGIPFYSVKDISSGGLDTTNPKYISAAEFEKFPDGAKPQYGDILFGRVGTLGKPTIVNTNSPFGIFVSLGFFRKYSHEITSEFFIHWMNSSLFWDQVNMNVKGAVLTNLNTGWLSKFLIPIPPSKEQAQIVAQCEIAIRYLEKIENTGRKISNLISAAKSKILDLAIRGKLVPQNPDDEPASVLLDRIREEKEELIKQGKIKRDKKESVIYKGDDNSYYLKMGNVTETLDDWSIEDIPDSWCVCCLGEVCDYGNCTNVDTKDISETAWILDLEDIEKGTGKVLQKLTLKERNSASTKHLFHKGQVLYSKLRPYLNKVVLADDDGFCTSEILPLDFNGYILPEYAKCYMMSPTFLRYANHCSYGVKMPRLGTLDGKKAVLTVPPINEQKRIADKVSQLFSLLDSIAENVN